MKKFHTEQIPSPKSIQKNASKSSAYNSYAHILPENLLSGVLEHRDSFTAGLHQDIFRQIASYGNTYPTHRTEHMLPPRKSAPKKSVMREPEPDALDNKMEQHALACPVQKLYNQTLPGENSRKWNQNSDSSNAKITTVTTGMENAYCASDALLYEKQPADEETNCVDRYKKLNRDSQPQDKKIHQGSQPQDKKQNRDNQPVGNENDLMDWDSIHAGCIRKKHLPLDEINGYNHMAVYLRWCIIHNLMHPSFLAQFSEVVQAVQMGEWDAGLRCLIREHLGGSLHRRILNPTGAQFAIYYYNHDHDGCELPCYPADVDDYALHYFGEERYYSDEFQGEAYLFIPYDAAYVQGLSAYIDRRWTQFQQTQAQKKTKPGSAKDEKPGK